MKKIIITGANGYIGTRLTLALASKGYQVVALVDGRFQYDALLQNNNIVIIESALETIETLYDSREIEGADTIYHLAWSGVNALYRNDAEVQVQNVMFSLKVMEFAEHHKINKVIIPGSAAESGCGDGVISGKEIPSPSDMYSASKVAARYVCRKYAAQHNINLVWCLITSIYGPGRNDNNLISYVIKSLKNSEKPSTTKLEQQWDYIYIDDLINALVLLGEKGIGGKIYPIGSGTHKQMREYVETIRDLINPDLAIGIGDLPYKDPNKIDNQIMDISELMSDTGFEAEYSFANGIKNLIKE